jgi:hypothetical protein
MEFEGKNILEVGAKYVNGSVRPLIEKFCKPDKYVGVVLKLESSSIRWFLLKN